MSDIKQTVLFENEKAHDRGAPFHTRAVPYQCRKRTRDYIWKLISEQLEKHEINPEGAKIAEVACGTGTFVGLAEKWNAESYDGFDISGGMIKFAKENNKWENARFYKSSLEDFSKNNEEKYDIIISSSFLHHLVDLQEGLTQIQRMLRASQKCGGIYIALHEIDNTRTRTRVEVFDNELSLLFGYQGQIIFPLRKRIKKFWRYMRKEMFRRSVPRQYASSDELVDY